MICGQMIVDGFDPCLQICRSQEGYKALPTAHTCFNQLVLPAYQSCEQLRERLTYALDESGASFGMT
jgi:E3 ubiquitin-protein ligase HUWE1